MRGGLWRRLVGCGLLLICGCDAETAFHDGGRGWTAGRSPSADSGVSLAPVAPTPATPTVSGERGRDVRIATFNIQVFGTKKEKDLEVMEILATVVRQFDVVAIQEVRAADQELIPRFVDLVNSKDVNYAHVIGPRLGRTSSKEQYAFVFNQERLELLPGSVYTADDPDDLLHREPLVARFRVRGPNSQEAFTFTLINVHTDPDEVDQEVDALADAFTAVQQNGSGEDDVILLGDLNADERHLGRLGRLPGITWVVTGVPTNTRGTESYDNILFGAEATREYTGRWGVFDLQAEFSLTPERALDVSDHRPVWAAFSAYEGGTARIAAKNRNTE